MTYTIPHEHDFRLHHCRPRFKNNIESVLGFVSFGIAEIGKCHTEEFNERLNTHIISFQDNALKTLKTINNWRTEISSLFGLYYEEEDISYPTQIAIDLANETNLELFFKRFISVFQYPGGHLKQQEILDMVTNGISYHPGRWLSKFFLVTRQKDLNHSCISAPEFCHCVLNDMRVTRDGEDIISTINRIITNRNTRVEYDTQGDVIRYAKDILDYMVLAKLLTKKEEYYYVREQNLPFITALAESNFYFNEYDGCTNNSEIAYLKPSWIKYVNTQSVEFTNTDGVLHTIIEKDITQKAGIHEEESMTEHEVEVPVENDEVIPEHFVKGKEIVDTKKIGDKGESLVLVHEKLRIELEGRPDLQHLIKLIPTHLAVGYDVKSIEVVEDDRFVEVKTSVSTNPLTFNRIHLTTNEWRVAETHREKYYIYRLQITESEGYILFLLQDPVGQYKQDKLRMIPRDGADIIFSDDCGVYLDLLQ